MECLKLQIFFLKKSKLLLDPDAKLVSNDASESDVAASCIFVLKNMSKIKSTIFVSLPDRAWVSKKG